MRFDQYSSEREIYVHSLIQLLQGREDEIMAEFIQKGPDELKKLLRIHSEEDWTMIFDYLVFQKDLLKRCVMQFLPFFKDLIREEGPFALRKVLGIEAKMYDKVFEQIFDLVAISYGALFEYVQDNSYDFVEKIKKGKAQDLRELLCLGSRKYARIWQKTVEQLCLSLNEQIVSEAMMERGLVVFNTLLNKVRTHRSIRTYQGIKY